MFQWGPAEEIPRFEPNLDRVTINCRSINFAISCVQSHVRNPLFTKRDFFTGNGISLLLSAVNIAGSVCEDSAYDPWNLTLLEGIVAVVDELKRAYDVVDVRQKDARDTAERWFGVASVESSIVGESSGQQGNRVSIIVDVGEAEYLPQSVSTLQMPSTSSSVKNLAKGKWKQSETPALVAIKRRFEYDDESVVMPMRRGLYFEVANVAIALRDEDEAVSSRRSGRSCCAAPVFQSSPL